MGPPFTHCRCECVCVSRNSEGKPGFCLYSISPSQGINRQLRILLYLMAKCWTWKHTISLCPFRASAISSQESWAKEERVLSAVSVTVLSAAFTLLEGNKVTSKLLERYEVKLNWSFLLLSSGFFSSCFVMGHYLLQTKPCLEIFYKKQYLFFAVKVAWIYNTMR